MGQLTLATAGSAILLWPVAQARAQSTETRAPDAAAESAATEAATEAAPAPLQYEVKVNAPGDLEELLEKNLDLERFRGNPRMDREQLQRLVRDTPEQVKNLVATAGYYTPVVTVRLDTTGA